MSSSLLLRVSRVTSQFQARTSHISAWVSQVRWVRPSNRSIIGTADHVLSTATYATPLEIRLPFLRFSHHTHPFTFPRTGTLLTHTLLQTRCKIYTALCVHRPRPSNIIIFIQLCRNRCRPLERISRHSRRPRSAKQLRYHDIRGHGSTRRCPWRRPRSSGRSLRCSRRCVRPAARPRLWRPSSTRLWPTRSTLRTTWPTHGIPWATAVGLSWASAAGLSGTAADGLSWTGASGVPRTATGRLSRTTAGRLSRASASGLSGTGISLVRLDDRCTIPCSSPVSDGPGRKCFEHYLHLLLTDHCT